ncbi:MAG: ribosome small subunit-dependent GTPase A [Lachnospiraceae bacterium]|nr:ribosome small subunit-dependent GTPase A [Lachnospiraceae bacterium]
MAEAAELIGTILRGVGGFYDVETDGGERFVCRPRGSFRKEKIRPLPGDVVRFVVTHERDREGSLTQILPRRNALIRPAVANVDQALLFFSVREPDPSFLLADRYLLFIAELCLPTLLCFNKSEIADGDEVETIREIYRGAGLPLLFVSVRTGEGLPELVSLLADRTTFLAGPSGAGKSSFINAVCPSAAAETGELSKKLARGKNTTRHSELFRVAGLADERVSPHTWLIDTPGFTALELPDMEEGTLDRHYPEFMPYRDRCRFASCRHLDEPGCAVREAAENGSVSDVRYRNYRQLYGKWKELRDRKYR